MPRKSAAPKSYKAVDNLGLAYKVCKRYQPTGEIEDSEVLSDAYLALFRAEKHTRTNQRYLLRATTFLHLNQHAIQ
jgi:hypothetical protein